MTDKYLKTDKPLSDFSWFPEGLEVLWPTGEQSVFKELAAPWLMKPEYRHINILFTAYTCLVVAF